MRKGRRDVGNAMASRSKVWCTYSGSKLFDGTSSTETDSGGGVPPLMKSRRTAERAQMKCSG